MEENSNNEDSYQKLVDKYRKSVKNPEFLKKLMNGKSNLKLIDQIEFLITSSISLPENTKEFKTFSIIERIEKCFSLLTKLEKKNTIYHAGTCESYASHLGSVGFGVKYVETREKHLKKAIKIVDKIYPFKSKEYRENFDITVVFGSRVQYLHYCLDKMIFPHNRSKKRGFDNFFKIDLEKYANNVLEDLNFIENSKYKRPVYVKPFIRGILMFFIKLYIFKGQFKKSLVFVNRHLKYLNDEIENYVMQSPDHLKEITRKEEEEVLRVQFGELYIMKAEILVKMKDFKGALENLRLCEKKKSGFDDVLRLNLYRTFCNFYDNSLCPYQNSEEFLKYLNNGIEVSLRLNGLNQISVKLILRRANYFAFTKEYNNAKRDIKRISGYTLFNKEEKKNLELLKNIVKRKGGRKKGERKKKQPKSYLAKCSYLRCGNIEKKEKEFMVCSGCRAAKYCSRKCQKMDWKICHKKQCRKTREPKKQNFLSK